MDTRRDVIDEKALIDYIVRCRQNGMTDTRIREVLVNLLNARMDELMPLSGRILESWRNALEINENGTQPQTNPQT